LVVKAGNGCCEWLSTIPHTIRQFFIHAYADVRMYYRAFSSMGSGTTPREIERRVNEVTQFLTVIENNTDSAVTSWDFNGVKNRYQRLSPQVRDLFFTVDQNYINEFGGNHPLRPAQVMREEMIRECNRVISFQRQLTSVNHFYRLFSGRGNQPGEMGRTEPATSSSDGRRPRPHLPDPDLDDARPWEDIFEGFLGGRRRGGAGEVTTSNTTGTSMHSLDLNVPGTVQYAQNAIPQDVQDKADEINRLSQQFAVLRSPPVVPTIFNDTIMSNDFMAIPVFDASHPEVQERLRAANAPGATTAARDALEERTNRHPYDKDALEAQIRAGTSWAPAKCYLCRHPADGGIRREYLRIDTALQNQILQFLRNAVAAGGSTTR
jgi:hypothetical protein